MDIAADEGASLRSSRRFGLLQEVGVAKTLINPPQMYDGSAVGLSHAVVIPAGKLVFVSGQVAWDLEQRVTADTVEGQLEDALANLATVLEAAGASVGDLVQVRVYVRGELATHMEAIAPVMAAFLGASRAALTGIGVASLASPETLVEVEAIAAVGASAPTATG
jgi:2-iminobutanoate/2-iminopropanoate deaminase